MSRLEKSTQRLDIWIPLQTSVNGVCMLEIGFVEIGLICFAGGLATQNDMPGMFCRLLPAHQHNFSQGRKED